MKSLTIPIQASFKKEIEISDLEKINLFFGYNGSGKTTISRVLINEENAFIYNEDFIEDNFRNVDKQKGIFTIGKEAGDAKEKIIQSTLKKTKYQEQLDKLQGSEEKDINGLLNDKKKATTKNWNTIVGKLWNIKVNTENLKLKDCIPGLRGNKEKLAKSFVGYFTNAKRVIIPQTKFESLWRELLKRGEVVFNTSLEKKTPLRLQSIKPLEKIVTNEIWKKKIIGNKDSNLNELYEQLKNSNWVSQGRDFLNEQDLCPFCQQPLRVKFLDELKEYFNESYEIDKALTTQLKRNYNYEDLLATQKKLLVEEFTSDSKLELKITEFEQLLNSNDIIIDAKISKPS
ncbi:MAG: AAA family ATPase, partial [Candidatus Pelagibacter ubique]